MRRKSLYVFSVVAALVLVLTTGLGSALAFDCVPANKPTGAGSVATVEFVFDEEGNIVGENITPNKNNPAKGELGPEAQLHGGFVTLDFGEGGTYDIFVQTVLPVVIPDHPAYQGNDKLSDGKGIDSLGSLLGAE